MTDLALAGGWLGLLGAALGACMLARALGLPATYVRDGLHIGAGVWIVGWPWWDGPVLPVAIVALAALITALMPALARESRLAARLVRSVTGGDERWTGLVHYTLAYAVFTTLGLVGDPFPAAAALLALSLGDGLGGAIGRKLGRHHFRAPGAKPKSLEGSVVVALAAMIGVAVAAHLFGRDVSGLAVLGLGVVASATEALAPRSTDNLLIPIAVWTAATLVT
jgi:dolichol kinase